MKQLLLFLVFPIIGFSQCPPTGGSFTSQAQIDALAIDYPDCTEVGAFSISGDDITDLSGLNQLNSCIGFSISNNLVLQNTMGLNSNIVIRYVEGTGSSFTIENNASLLTINGLENFVSQSGFESYFTISNNPILTSLEGLPNSLSAVAWCTIQNNDALVNLNGFGDLSGFESTSISNNDNLLNLVGIGDMSAERLSISNNQNLQSLEGAGEIYYFDQLTIANNTNLTDISAIYIGSTRNFDPIIRNNPNLSLCSSENVCNFFASIMEEGEMLRGNFENNAPGCNSVFEAEYGCGINSNDDCSSSDYPGSSLFITLGETIQANNEFATTSEQTPNCNDIPNRKDVWFAFSSGENTIVDIIVSEGFYLQLWDAGTYDFYIECGSQTLVTDGCGNESLIDFVVNPNTNYLIQVWSDAGGRRATGWFNILVQDGLLSIPEFEFDDISIYPNPAQNELHIQSNSPIDIIQVFNLLGQQVLESNATTLDVSNLTEGIYLVKVYSNGKASTYKIVKQ